MAGSFWVAMSCWLTPSFVFLFLNLTIGIIIVISAIAAPRDKQRSRQQPIARSPSLLERARSFNFSSFASGSAVSHSAPHPSGSEADESPPHEFVRPSSFLDRARSFKFSFFAAELPQGQEAAFQAPADSDDSGHSEEMTESESPQLVRASSLLDRLRAFNLSFKKHDLHPNVNPEPTDGILDQAEPPDRYRVRINQQEPELGRRFPFPRKMTRSASSNPLWRKEAGEEEEDDVDRRRPASVRERRSAAMVDEEVDAKADDFINRFKQQLKLQRLDSLLRYRGMHNSGAAQL